MPRGRCNKDTKRGINNRQNGIYKKANHLFKYYPGTQVGVIIIHQDGRPTAYQSCAGLIDRISSLNFKARDICGPDEYDTVADRRSHSPGDCSEAAILETSSTYASPQSQATETQELFSDCKLSVHSPNESTTGSEAASTPPDQTSETSTPLGGSWAECAEENTPQPNTQSKSPTARVTLPYSSNAFRGLLCSRYRETLMSLANMLDMD